MITDYKDKKLAEYLEPGMKALIRFGHGLGDTIMFMPAFTLLRRLYPETQIDLYVECGQEEIFESVPDKEGKDYDKDELTWLWDVTTIADKTIIENNQAGVNSRYYTPGPFSEMEDFTVGMINWYLDTMR